jgi:signal transduction histidine kinase
VAKRDPVVRYVDLPDKAAIAASLTPYESRCLDLINRKVAARESLEAIIDLLFTSTQSISPCDRIGLSFVEEDGQRTTAHYVRAQYKPTLLNQGYTEDMQGSSLQHVLQMRSPRIINDLQRYADEHPSRPSPRLLLREGVRSSMTCPLTLDGRVVGLLFRSSRRPHAYDEHQAFLHQSVAERLAQAVEKTYSIEQLAAANRAYSEMLEFVTHELEGPIASMVTAAQLLTEGQLDVPPSNHREHLKQFVVRGKHLLNNVREYRHLSRVENGTLRLRPQTGVDFMTDVVNTSIDTVRPQIEGNAMKLIREFPSTPLLADCDPDLLRIVVVGLLANAAKYGRNGGEIRLRVEQPEQMLKVLVWNEGPGFRLSERPRLFRKFSRLTTPELLQQKGGGVALYTAWRIIQLHGGRLGAKSEHGKWAEFYFEIPQPLRASESEADSIR